MVVYSWKPSDGWGFSGEPLRTNTFASVEFTSVVVGVVWVGWVCVIVVGVCVVVGWVSVV